MTAGTDDSGRHTITVETPTGAHHHSPAPPILPGRRQIDHSEVEHLITVTLWDQHAA